MILDFMIALVCYDIIKFVSGIVFVMMNKEASKKEWEKESFKKKLRDMVDDSNKNKQN